VQCCRKSNFSRGDSIKRQVSDEQNDADRGKEGLDALYSRHFGSEEG